MIDIKKKSKNVRVIALFYLTFYLCSFMPYMGFLSVISATLYMIVLYQLKTYTSAKNLFKNYFITLFILFFYFILLYDFIFLLCFFK